jgi:hypothetical protein
MHAAYTQNCRPRERGDPATFVARHWIPAPDSSIRGQAFAGMTMLKESFGSNA